MKIGYLETRLLRTAIWTLIVLVIALALIAWLAVRILGVRESTQRRAVDLVRVVDGDTLVIRDKSGMVLTVRLSGVNSPELGTAQSFASALYTATALEEAERIEFEPEIVVHRRGGLGPKHDKYGRELGWIWVVNRAGNISLLQEELLRRGYAGIYEGGLSRYEARLRRAVRVR